MILFIPAGGGGRANNWNETVLLQLKPFHVRWFVFVAIWKPAGASIKGWVRCSLIPSCLDFPMRASEQVKMSWTLKTLRSSNTQKRKKKIYIYIIIFIYFLKSQAAFCCPVKTTSVVPKMPLFFLFSSSFYSPSSSSHPFSSPLFLFLPSCFAPPTSSSLHFCFSLPPYSPLHLCLPFTWRSYSSFSKAHQAQCFSPV